MGGICVLLPVVVFRPRVLRLPEATRKIVFSHRMESGTVLIPASAGIACNGAYRGNGPLVCTKAR